MPPFPNTDKRRKALTCNCRGLLFVLLKIVPCLFFFSFLFAVFPRWLTSSRWSWISLFQTLSETYWSEQYMLTLYLLWEARGHRSCCWCFGWNVEGLGWTESMVGTTNKVFSWNTLSWPKTECVSWWVRFILVIDPWELEREIASLFGDALWINISDLKDTVHCDFWGPNELS